MAITTVIAGAYTSTLGGVALNYTRDGFELFIDTHGEAINETDLWGDSMLEIVHRGSSARIVTECRIYAVTASLLGFYPWADFGQIATSAKPIGRLGSAVASSLVLTAVSNTPAAATPASLTASKSIVAPGSNLRLLFTSKARSVPLNFQLLPSESGGTLTYFVPA